MSTLSMMASHGQSFWLDEMSRGLITSGRLARLVREDGLRGMTSNPTLFARAFLSGLDRRKHEGLGVSSIASVASFFVSRVDTLVDGMIDEMRAKATAGEKQQLGSLRGKAAIANAKVAYSRFRELFHGGAFAA